MANNQPQRIDPQRTRAERFPQWTLVTAIAAMLAAFWVVLSGQGSLLLQRLEQGYADIRTFMLAERMTIDHPNIVIVSVGENVSATRATFNRSAAVVDRSQIARLIEIIDESAPRAIGFDVPLAGATDATVDQQLQRILREARARVVIGIRDGSTDGGIERRAWLQRFVQGTGRQVGRIGLEYQGDRVTRVAGMQPSAAGPADSFALLIAQALRPATRAGFEEIAWLQKSSDAGLLSRLLNFSSQQPFRMIYASELLDTANPVPPRQLAGRLVLVTTGIADIERHRTPLTLLGGELAAPIQIQAQAIAQLLDERAVSALPPRTSRLMLFWLGCIAGLVGWYRGVRGSLIGGLVMALALVVIDAFTFTWYGLALPLVPGLLVWLLGDTAGRGLRRVLRWEERHGQLWPAGSDAEPRSARTG